MRRQIILLEQVSSFVSKLNPLAVAKLMRELDLLEEFGTELGMPHARALKHGLYELRVRGKQEVRIFYVYHEGKIYLLHGIVKKSQKLNQNDIDLAIKRYRQLTEL